MNTERGFSLTELMMTVAVGATLMTIALPVMTDVTQSAKLNSAVRMVERELQSARLRSVSTNSIQRVRTNCPSAGFLRTVELLGTAADTSATRCSATAYPFPPADDDLATRPNFDGPPRTLPDEATVTDAVLEFRPDGTAYHVVAGVPQTISSPVTLTVTRRFASKTVTINGLGKVLLQ